MSAVPALGGPKWEDLSFELDDENLSQNKQKMHFVCRVWQTY